MTSPRIKRFLNAARRRKLWIVWLLTTLVAASVLGMGVDYKARSDASAIGRIRGLFSPAAVLPGHQQLQLQCVACHAGSPAAGGKDMQGKCVDCHQRNDDNRAENTHPRSKFEDPSNADRLKAIDALHCTTCHGEHKPDAVNHVGLTIPKDFCVACHQKIAEEAPSHEGMGFTTCTNAGCHSYHDNRGTYRKLLKKHVGKGDPPPERRRVPELESHGPASAQAAVNNPHGKGPVIQACQECHTAQAQTFEQGKHGVRKAVGLQAMSPAISQKPFLEESRDKRLGCTTCHEASQPDTRKAAVEGCVSCHADEHTKAYFGSKHELAWRNEAQGTAPMGSGVSCATCHMPRHDTSMPDGSRHVAVNHDNTLNLRPSIKQTRVCMACHSLQFTHDALADGALAKRNFKGQPSVSVKSIEMESQRR